jgi:hypothetical protein
VNLLQKIVTPDFITFMAHMFCAAFVVLVLALFGYNPLKLWVAVALIAGFKEFYIDKHFEADQTFKDNLLDWLGYMAGATLALITLVALVFHYS